MKNYKVWFGVACMAVCGLAFSLTACSNDSSSVSEEDARSFEPIEATQDSIVTLDSLKVIESVDPNDYVRCSTTLNSDGQYFSHDFYSHQGLGNMYYKCEDDKWNVVSRGDIPEGANIFTQYQVMGGDEGAWLELSKCNADNEGQVDSTWGGNHKMGNMLYYRCENGSWELQGIWVTCDTVGVSVGDFCRRTLSATVLGTGRAIEMVYVYAGDGVWNELEGPATLDEVCSSDNEGERKKFSYGDNPDDTYYLECSDYKWIFILNDTETSDEKDSAYCDTLKAAAPPYECNESLMVDGYYYAFTGHVYPGLGGCTFKCQHNEWSFVPAKDVPEDAKKFSDYDIVARPEEVGMLNFKKCNADNEGLVDSLSTGSSNPKGGSARVYYRCEQENWVESPAWVACDTAGVSEGEICRLQTSSRGSQFGSDIWECYRYAGNGAWEEQECEDSSDDPADSNSVQEE